MQGPLSAGGDTAAPQITSVVEVIANYDPYLYYPRTMTLRVTFSESMLQSTGTGTRLAINCGGTTRYAVFSSWESATAALYVWAVSSTDHDEDGPVMSSPLDLNGGTLKDLAGNVVSPLTFTPPDLSGFRVVLRGMIWGSRLIAGADPDTVYASIDGTTISAYNARKSPYSALTFDGSSGWSSGGEIVDSIGYTGSAFATDILDSSNNWSYHVLGYFPSSSSHYENLVSTSEAGGSKGKFLQFIRVGSDDVFYCTKSSGVDGSVTKTGGFTKDAWHTISFVNEAGTVSVYVDGTLVGTIADVATTTLNSNREEHVFGYTWRSGGRNQTNTAGTKILLATLHSVAHSAAEVAAVHNYFGNA